MFVVGGSRQIHVPADGVWRHLGDVPGYPGGSLSNAAGGVFAFWLIATDTVIYRRLGSLPVNTRDPIDALRE